MPTKKRITRSAIVETAVEILRSEGWEKINARRIAHQLQCSTQPIYSEFGSMEGLKEALKKEAEEVYLLTVSRYRNNPEHTAYMAFGLGFIRFAKEEKELFRYLYMRDRHGDGKIIEDVNGPDILHMLTESYGFPEEQARWLHHDMSIYSYGLAVMLNTNYLDMEEAEIKRRLRIEFVALSHAYGLQDLLRDN